MRPNWISICARMWAPSTWLEKWFCLFVSVFFFASFGCVFERAIPPLQRNEWMRQNKERGKKTKESKWRHAHWRPSFFVYVSLNLFFERINDSQFRRFQFVAFCSFFSSISVGEKRGEASIEKTNIVKQMKIVRLNSDAQQRNWQQENINFTLATPSECPKKVFAIRSGSILWTHPADHEFRNICVRVSFALIRIGGQKVWTRPDTFRWTEISNADGHPMRL